MNRWAYDTEASARQELHCAEYADAGQVRWQLEEKSSAGFPVSGTVDPIPAAQ